MNTQNYFDVISDQEFSKGFEKGTKSMQKKYDKLLEAASQFFFLYDSTFGAPDNKEENDEYWNLEKIIRKHYK